MKKLIQTRVHNPPIQKGNCFPTVIACFLDLDSAEEVLQIQEYYDDENWLSMLCNWLNENGWEWGSLRGHAEGFYLVTGDSPRGIKHICIYKDGSLYHDPHPSGEGLINEEYFEYLDKI